MNQQQLPEDDPGRDPAHGAGPTAVTAAQLRTELVQSRAKHDRLIAAAERPNSVRAWRSDLRYFWAWARVQAGIDASAPPLDPALVETFVIEHLGGLNPRTEAALRDAGIKVKPGPHKLATVRRRLSSLARAEAEYRARQPDSAGADRAEPVYTLTVKRLLKAAQRQGANRPARKDPITRDELTRLFAALPDADPRSVLLRAVLAVGFASGGRRRSELCALQVADLRRYDFPEAPGYYYTLRLGQTKTTDAVEETCVPVLYQAAEYLAAWLRESGLEGGRLFRAVRPGGQLSRQMSPEWLARRLKEVAARAGLDATRISPHSLRSGFVTQCGRDGVSPQDAMALTQHRSLQVFTAYYRAGALRNNPAGALLRGTTVPG